LLVPLLALTFCGSTGQDRVVSAEGSATKCKRFCVSVEPRNGDTKTIFTFLLVDGGLTDG
jgi:hypothetical protein